ncbi:activator of Hsp90 ATPase [Salix suchowensis]|nr:activator of Hsp90 ATPase [Salix suchowensis]
MALPPSTANWHWKNKNVTRWAREWFEQELVTISVKGDSDGEVARVSRVTEVDGDVELGQRKSKACAFTKLTRPTRLITIYDCKITLDWSGQASDGTEVEGKLTVPEVSHENTLDRSTDYVYDWSLVTSASPAVLALYEVIKKRLPEALEAKFAEFPQVLINTHGRDLTVSADPSRTGTPAPSGSATPAAATSANAPPVPNPKPAKKENVNTATVSVNANLVASADDLKVASLDARRGPGMRSHFATICVADAEAVVVANSRRRILAVRRRCQWKVHLTRTRKRDCSVVVPQKSDLAIRFVATIVKSVGRMYQGSSLSTGHSATLTTTLEQGSDSTKITLSLAGVPTGSEEEITRNLEGY